MKKFFTKQLIKKAIREKPQNKTELERLKKDFSRKKGSKEEVVPILANAEMRKVYQEMVENREIKPSAVLENLLVTKEVRTLSGVAIVAVLTKSFPCPGKCAYCPDENKMPKSYLSNEPAVMRAISVDFHPYKQVQARLKMLEAGGHRIDKIEVIVMGGTFSHFSKRYRNWFIKETFRALNDYPKNYSGKSLTSNLEKEKKRNEKAQRRMVGLTLETRPDYVDLQEVVDFRKLGATRVEMGVQHLDEEVLKLNQRGHLIKEVVYATKILKEAGFKISYHLMPGLPGSDTKKDLAMVKKVFSDERFQPDLVKIYPCVVTRGSKIEKWWKEGRYFPLSNEENVELIKKIKAVIPPYVRISRLIRDIPEESILAGPNISNLRQIIQQKGVACRCIRCREVKADFSPKQEMILNRLEYKASGGKEIFLEYVSPDKKKLFAMLRLRIPGNEPEVINKLTVLKNCALIREVHTYGKVVGINKKEGRATQHIGLGRRLIQEAEKITREEFDVKKIAIISGVGVREYYKKLGYRLREEYMVKKI